MSWTEALPYIATMALVTYLVRAVPLVLFRKKITSRRIKAFLFYVPYAVLAAMTIPGIFTSTPSIWSAAAGAVAAFCLAWKDKGLFIVSIGAALASLAVLLLGA